MTILRFVFVKKLSAVNLIAIQISVFRFIWTNKNNKLRLQDDIYQASHWNSNAKHIDNEHDQRQYHLDVQFIPSNDSIANICTQRYLYCANTAEVWPNLCEWLPGICKGNGFFYSTRH